MEKIDFKKPLKSLYAPSKKDFSVIEVPEMAFSMIDGHGDPNTAPAYSEAVAALYTVAYKLKFISKKTLERDYVVPPLEGLWWANDMRKFTNSRDKSAWDWTMMIMQPEWINTKLFSTALAKVQKKKDLPGLPKVRLARYHE